eukprot:GFUD01023040.1.p1 GENE.GFUD01023040.1~~GFUD01023040.1.p1  ORF type:complete len:103 (+),score=14.12 GFUD01023040.1:63-371(+)
MAKKIIRITITVTIILLLFVLFLSLQINELFGILAMPIIATSLVILVYMDLVQSPGTVQQTVYQARIAEYTLPSRQRQETTQTPRHPPDSDEPPSYDIAIYM